MSNINLTLIYDYSEILRIIDSMALTDKYKVATPVDWKQGDDCMVLPTVKNEELSTLYPAGVHAIEVPSGKNYIRSTPCPK